MSGTLLSQSPPFDIAGTGRGAGTLYRGYEACDSRCEGSYATVEELFIFGLSENVQHDFQDPGFRMLKAQLRRASREADAFVGHRFERIPLRAYSEAWVGWVCQMAGFFAMERRGWKPGDEGVEQSRRFYGQYKRAIEFIKLAQAYQITPDRELLNSDGDASPASVVSAPNRGWLR
jgi:phage gp36-like protein